MPDADGTPAKKLQVMQLEGYLPTAKANLELQESLQKTKVSTVTAHVTTAVFCITLVINCIFADAVYTPCFIMLQIMNQQDMS